MLIALLDIEGDVLAIAKELYGLPLVRRIGNSGQCTRIGKSIFGSGSGKALQSHPIDSNSEQLNRRGCLLDKSERIGIGCPTLRRDTDGSNACLIRRGDSHLLAFFLIDRNGGTGRTRQRNGIGQRCALEARQSNAIEINHIEEGVLGLLNNKNNGIGILGTALRRNRDALHIVLAHTEHLLRSLRLVVGDGRNGADANGERIGVVCLIGREAL